MTKNGVTFAVRVVARASLSEIVGEHDGALRVRIAAAPVEGAANDELTKTIAKAFGVANSNVYITSGHNSKSKRICVVGIEQTRAQEVLQSFAANV